MMFLRLALLLICLSPLWSASALVEGALQQQGEAEAALAQTRKDILQQRQRLLQELADEQLRLTQAQNHSETLKQQRQQLEHLQAQRDLQAREQKEDYQLRIERACASIALPLFQGSDPQAFKQHMQSGLDELFATLDQAQQMRTASVSIANRDGKQVDATVIYCGAVQQLALTDQAQHSGFLLSDGDVSVVNGPLLNKQQYSALKDLAKQQYGVMIVDLDGSLVKQVATQETWSSWLAKGGVFIWPIIAVGLLAAILAGERFAFLIRMKGNPQLLTEVTRLLAQGQVDAAMQQVQSQATPLQRIVYVGLRKRDQRLEARETALEAVLVQEESLLERSRPLLAVLAAIAPLLGLLGTVTGMIATFQSIALFGTANPQLLSNGISEALITTQMGLLVAVPILLVIGIINRMADKQRVLLEQGASVLLGSAQEQTDDAA